MDQYLPGFREAVRVVDVGAGRTGKPRSGIEFVAESPTAAVDAALIVGLAIALYYVPDLDVRLGLYRRLSGLSKKVELEGFAAELIDRFGLLPDATKNLVEITRSDVNLTHVGRETSVHSHQI